MVWQCKDKHDNEIEINIIPPSGIFNSIELNDLDGELSNCKFNTTVSSDSVVSMSMQDGYGESIVCDISKDEFLIFAEHIAKTKNQIN